MNTQYSQDIILHRNDLPLRDLSVAHIAKRLLNAGVKLAVGAALLFSMTSDAEAQKKTRTQYRGMVYNGDSVTDITDLRALKANFVSYQLVWGGEASDTATLAQYNAWLESRLPILDQLLNTCQSLNMKMLIVLHTPPGGFASRATPSLHRIFVDNAMRDAFKQTWQNLAARYASHPALYGFDLLNEPAVGSTKGLNASQLWNTLAPELTAIVRAAAPNAKIVIEPVYGNPGLFPRLTPVSDNNVEYSFHSYFDAKFRNQGLDGRAINAPYPEEPKKGKKGRRFNFAALKNSVKGAVVFQRKHKKKNIKILAGEFAAPRWAPKKGALKYIRDSIKIFESSGWNWVNHAWREADVWSIEHTDNFNDKNRSPTETERSRMLQGFFKKNK